MFFKKTVTSWRNSAEGLVGSRRLPRAVSIHKITRNGGKVQTSIQEEKGRSDGEII